MTLCKICNDREATDNHHILPRSKGGPDTPDNLILICGDCHYKIHHPDSIDADVEQFNPEYRKAIGENLFSEGWGIVPNRILRDKKLSPFSKILYCEISSLCSSKGYCWASNRYFAELFNKDTSTISRALGQLEKYVLFENRNSGQRRIWAHTLTRQPRQKRPGNLGKNASHNSIKNSIITDTDTEPSATPPVAPFDLEGTLKRWEDGKVRRFEILAWYIRGARLAAKSKQELENIKGRHIRSATRLEAYTDDELTGAWKKAQALGDKLGFAPTLDTVLKQLTQ